MNKIFFFVLCMAVSLLLAAQGGEADSLSRVQDSLRQAIEKRWLQYQRQHRIYERMFAEDPKRAIDSLVLEENRQNLEAGLQRLEKYRRNQRLDTLKELDLSYANLREIPDFVYRAENIEVLILNNNQIKRLPKRLKRLSALTRIYWRENNLEDVWWIRIQRIEGLEKLDLSNNTLTRLPHGVRKLTGLEELVLDENIFEEVPVRGLKRADFVERVSFNNIPMLELTKNDYHKLDFLKVFKANGCGMKNIDPSFYQMSGLEELQLQENKLSALPEGISGLASLRKLSFYKNELTGLPSDLFDLDLTIIDLYYNQLEVIPDEIGRLQKLEILFLAHNKIYALPESLGELTNLDQIYLHNNRLSVLPASLTRLEKLKVARINNNYLMDFPRQFLEMKYLEDLDISNNQIASIPAGVGELESLQLFTYQENPIDFNSRKNSHLAGMIVKMMESGTTCVPRAYKEEVRDTSQTSKEMGQ